MGKDTRYRQRQAELTQSFLTQLELVLNELSEMRLALESDDNQSSIRQEFKTVAHRLAGSAGIFGFQDIATNAVEAEEVLTQVEGLDSTRDQSTRVIKAIEALIESIKKVIR